MAFLESLQMGKRAEQYAERYFEQNNLKYTDVRDNTEYQKKDIDYIANGITYEVKQNYHNAIKYHPGKFFWIELEVGHNQGWWYFCEADYFMFFNGHGDGLLIKNDIKFKERINHLIKNGDHSRDGLNRFDVKYDERTYQYIPAKSMRVYLEQIDGLYIKLVNRK